MPETERESERWREDQRERLTEAVGLMVAGQEAEGDPTGELAPLLFGADTIVIKHLASSLVQMLLSL